MDLGTSPDWEQPVETVICVHLCVICGQSFFDNRRSFLCDRHDDALGGDVVQASPDQRTSREEITLP